MHNTTGVVVELSSYWRAGLGPTRRRRKTPQPAAVLPSNPARELILPDPDAPFIVLEALEQSHECAHDGFSWTAWVDDPAIGFYDRLELGSIAAHFRSIPGVDDCHTERDHSFHVASSLDGVVLRRALSSAYRQVRRLHD